MGIMYKLMKHKKLNLDLREPQNNTNIKNERNRLITIEGNIIEGATSVSKDVAEDDATQNIDSSSEKQFTAEHIIQLCKFLAEKSRKNKSLYRQQQGHKKLGKSKQTQFALQDHDNYDEIDVYQNEALPLLSKQRLEQKDEIHPANENHQSDELELHRNASVLSARLSPDINSLNISLNNTTANSCALQYHQQLQPQNINNNYPYQHQHQQQQQQQQHQHQPQLPQTQGKRDILLKIRRQIIERKRLRENGAFQPQALNNSQVWRPW